MPIAHRVLRAQSRALCVYHTYPQSHFGSTAADPAYVCSAAEPHSIPSFVLFLSFFLLPPTPRVKRGLMSELRLSLNPWSSSCLRRLSVVGLQVCATHSAAALLVSVFLSQPAFLFFGESLHALVKLSSFLPCRLWDVAFCLTSLTVFSSLPLKILGVGS